jgi:hypothetical protein
MVLDQSTVVFQITYKKSQVWKTLIVKVDRNQYLTLKYIDSRKLKYMYVIKLKAVIIISLTSNQIATKQ